MTAIERLSIVRTDPFTFTPWQTMAETMADHVESGFSNVRVEISKTTSRRQTLTDYLSELHENVLMVTP